MQIYHGIQEFVKLTYPVVTIGTFDGVHLGHQKILSRVRELAAAQNGESVIITFWPHPKYVLNPGNTMKLLSTFDEKAEYLDELGIDHLIRIPFTNEFSRVTSEEFVTKILIEKIGTKQLVIGYDHRFGKNREGSFEYLQENATNLGFEVAEISRKDVDHLTVSSTKIREHILQHKIHLANKLLGRAYQFSGIVVKGQQLGRKIGFPTANIEIAEKYKLIPSNGVYAVRVTVQGKLRLGMMNIGIKPTIGKQAMSIEVHVFNFDKEIYGIHLKVEVVKQIRKEMKFNDLQDLSDQLKIDSQRAMTILKEQSNQKTHDQ